MFTAPEAKVLVVDDIKTNLKVAYGFLEPYKMTVDMCLSGEEAVELVKNEVYHLIFMDYRMPDMDGIETTKKIRAIDDTNPYYKHLPIAALTADVGADRKEIFFKNGLDDFISKPIEEEKLHKILEKWIPKHLQVPADIDYGADGGGSLGGGGGSHGDGSVGSGSSGGSGGAAGLPQIEGIDIQTGIRLSGGTVQYFYETLASFYSDVLERFDLMSESINAGDLSRYSTFLHAIKAAAAIIGAGHIFDLAVELETAGDSGDIEFIKRNNDNFYTELKQLLFNIKPALAAYDARGTDLISDEHDELIKKELAILASALEVYDIVATNKSIDTLLRIAKTEEKKKAIRDISQHLLLFEYDKAMEIIKSMV